MCSQKIEKEHLSASQLRLISNCGEAYRLRYIEGFKIPPGIAAVKGTVFHKLPEKNNRQKIESKIDLSIEDMKDVVSDQTEIAFSEEVYLTKDEQQKGIAHLRGETKDQLIELVPKYHMAAETVMPREVESRQRIELKDHPRDLVYIIDVETIDDRIIDYKTSAKKKTQKEVDIDIGLTAYSMAFYVKHNKFPSFISFQNFVSYKTPKKGDIKTDYIELFTDRNAKDFVYLMNRIGETNQALDKGVFLPCNPGPRS